MSLDEINTWLCRLSKADCPRPLLWVGLILSIEDLNRTERWIRVNSSAYLSWYIGLFLHLDSNWKISSSRAGTCQPLNWGLLHWLSCSRLWTQTGTTPLNPLDLQLTNYSSWNISAFMIAKSNSLWYVFHWFCLSDAQDKGVPTKFWRWWWWCQTYQIVQFKICEVYCNTMYLNIVVKINFWKQSVCNE